MKYLKKIIFCSAFILNLCNGLFYPIGLFLGFQYSCHIDKDLLTSDRLFKTIGAAYGAAFVESLSNLVLSDKIGKFRFLNNKFTYCIITNRKLQVLQYLLILCGEFFDPVGLFLGFQYSCHIDKDLSPYRWGKALGASFGAAVFGSLSNLVLSDKIGKFRFLNNKFTYFIITNRKLQALQYLLRLCGGVLGYYYINKEIEMKKKSMSTDDN